MNSSNNRKPPRTQYYSSMSASTSHHIGSRLNYNNNRNEGHVHKNSSNKKKLYLKIAPLLCLLLGMVSYSFVTSLRLVSQFKTSSSTSTSTSSNTITTIETKWKPNPNQPWDGPPPNTYDPSETGSFQNCHTDSDSQSSSSSFQLSPHKDDGKITISCQTINYRAPKHKIHNAGPLIIGILSSANQSGPTRRDFIRSTWASSSNSNRNRNNSNNDNDNNNSNMQHPNHDNHNFSGAFFIVAGPWKDVEREYMFYQDMIWIDKEEVYDGLTYKTAAFFQIVYLLSQKDEFGRSTVLQHAFKTDDDSYANVPKLIELLITDKSNDESSSSSSSTKTDSTIHNNEAKNTPLHYYGQCPQFKVAPSRDQSNKWSVPYTIYPEPMFPLYCQGAGFGLSRDVLYCAIQQQHFEQVRYLPFEDAYIGMIAERCGYHPTMIAGVKAFRAETDKERACVRNNIPQKECYKDDPDWPPRPTIQKILIQHRVDTREDMYNHHESLGFTPRNVLPIPDDFNP